MTDKTETPPKLKPFLFHGVNLEWSNGDDNANGNCPFCENETKFGVTLETGQFHCWDCDIKGNGLNFPPMLYETLRLPTNAQCQQLTDNRNLLYDKTIEDWGLVYSPATSNWVVPGYDSTLKIKQLYRYTKIEEGYRWLPSPGLKHKMFGLNLWDKKAENIYVCEGIWDAMALWEVLGRTTEDFKPTTNFKESILQKCNVVAMPGTNVFDSKWCKLFRGKHVFLLYDNDHPRENKKTGKVAPPAGYTGMMKVASTLLSASYPPETVSYLRWGPEGYNLDLASGYDVRDSLCSSSRRGLRGRIEALRSILALVHPIPAEVAQEAAKGADREGSGDLVLPQECLEYKHLRKAWRKAFQWTEGLDTTLAVMLAAIASTKIIGDQLWVKIIGPASCGKSTLCEALSTASDYIIAKSTLRGFHSGFVTDGEAKEDHSLINKCKNKTLIIKDGDTLLQSPNLPQILSEARDIYDTVSRTSYRNKASRDYTGIRMTWLLCGTSSLRSIDNSELGERFLDCVIMEGIDEELEDEVAWRKANKANQSANFEANGEADTRQDPEMTNVMALTGGYVEYLRENVLSLLQQINFPDESLRECMKLAKFTSTMRARPSIHQEETSEREFSARLVSQFVRLSKMLTVVLNKTEVDKEVMNITRKVALDTSRGRTLEMARVLLEEGSLPGSMIASTTKLSQYKTRQLLRFLARINVVESFQPASRGIRQKTRWRLTDSTQKLYKHILGRDE